MPFSRKPLMIIVDSSNSHAFKVSFTYLFIIFRYWLGELGLGIMIILYRLAISKPR